MRVLLPCEESQAVCKEFRRLGHEAYSCDTEPCSGGHPEWHIQGDAMRPLWGGRWDVVIAFPPCTYLANSGVKHMYEGGKKENGFDMDRVEKMEAGARFFNQFVLYGKTGGKIAIENPIQHKYARELINKYNQIIHPYMFGHMEQKSTCIWTFNLPLLKETDNVYEDMMKLSYPERAKVHYCPPGPDRQKIRSKTFHGIAKAMAEQWGGDITINNK
jgi:hypothetical protein